MLLQISTSKSRHTEASHDIGNSLCTVINHAKFETLNKVFGSSIITVQHMKSENDASCLKIEYLKGTVLSSSPGVHVFKGGHNTGEIFNLCQGSRDSEFVTKVTSDTCVNFSRINTKKYL